MYNTILTYKCQLSGCYRLLSTYLRILKRVIFLVIMALYINIFLIFVYKNILLYTFITVTYLENACEYFSLSPEFYPHSFFLTVREVSEEHFDRLANKIILSHS